VNWDQIQVSWKQLREKFVFQWFRVTDDNGRRQTRDTNLKARVVSRPPRIRIFINASRARGRPPRGHPQSRLELRFNFCDERHSRPGCP
jgi:hypothetical protein